MSLQELVVQIYLKFLLLSWCKSTVEMLSSMMFGFGELTTANQDLLRAKLIQLRPAFKLMEMMLQVTGLLVSILLSISQNGMEKMERHTSINLNSLMMLIKATEIANLLPTKSAKMFQTTKLGEQEYILTLEITQSQSTVLFKLQKQLELNSTMLSVSF